MRQLSESEICEARTLQRFLESQSERESNNLERESYYNYDESEDEDW